MDSVDIFLLYVVGLCVILFLMVESYEESRKRRRKADVDDSDQETLVNGRSCDERSKMDDCSDDDWEGIERTELEKMFGEAVVFVNINEIDEGLKLKLYGLQMLALQGPCCHESQPMFFNVSARSKWNAWQKMGEMSREMAMEKYINTLVDAIPEAILHHKSTNIN
ncbi:hypothetical protein ACS0TY_029976 [Phlomoides rotata]